VIGAFHVDGVGGIPIGIRDLKDRFARVDRGGIDQRVNAAQLGRYFGKGGMGGGCGADVAGGKGGGDACRAGGG
jgi:hypothetical protein